MYIIEMSFSILLWEVLLLVCLHQHYSTAALPLDDWSSTVEKASSHKHWAHIVKRSSYFARYNSDNTPDDTSHIVNVQDYYRQVFDQGWAEDDYRKKEKELYRLLSKLEEAVEQDYPSSSGRVSSQSSEGSVEFGVDTKPIKGRYIVMFQSGADDYVLDRTIAVMERANQQSNRKIRATDMHPLRHVGKGFTATLNAKAVELVSTKLAVKYSDVDNDVDAKTISMYNIIMYVCY